MAINNLDFHINMEIAGARDKPRPTEKIFPQRPCSFPVTVDTNSCELKNYFNSGLPKIDMRLIDDITMHAYKVSSI